MNSFTAPRVAPVDPAGTVAPWRPLNVSGRAEPPTAVAFPALARRAVDAWSSTSGPVPNPVEDRTTPEPGTTKDQASDGEQVPPRRSGPKRVDGRRAAGRAVAFSSGTDGPRCAKIGYQI